MSSAATFSHPQALDALVGQSAVVDFFAAALREGRLSHAYLFVGAPGSGKTEAARALGKCVVCPNGGDNTCNECARVEHGTHPDVHLLSPGSAVGYLAAQVRDLIADAQLAPVRAAAKVYILTRADLLRGTAANALLKTLEEPPEGVIFILIARSADAVMPTIASRCQQVPFRTLSSDAALQALQAATGVDAESARIALSVAATPEAAREFLASPERQRVRRLVVQALLDIYDADSWDVLVAAREIVEAAKKPLAEFEETQKALAKQNADYLTQGAMKQLESANKRELSARERSGMMEALSATESLLRDALLRSEGVCERIVNTDAARLVERIAASTDTHGVLVALEATFRAADAIAHNVTPQLAFEAMLLSIKEALTCPPSSR